MKSDSEMVALQNLLLRSGRDVQQLEPLKSHTNQVFRAWGSNGSFIVRLTQSLDSTVTTRELHDQVQRASSLCRAGVGFAEPLTGDVLHDGTLHATLWKDLGTSEALDWTQVGQALRNFQVHGSRALQSQLPVLFDAGHLEQEYRKVSAMRLIPVGYLERALQFLQQTQEAFEQLPVVASSIIHDDLWSSNIITRQGKIHFIDPDNLAWGRNDHDLYFIAQAHTEKLISDEERDDFIRGYGEPLPSPETVTTFFNIHVLRLTPPALRLTRLDGKPLHAYQKFELWRERA